MSDKTNPYLVPAISTAKKLQAIIRRLVEKEKNIKTAVDNDTDFPAQVVKQFIQTEDAEAFEEETELLVMIDNLLYRLYDYEREIEAWHDEEDVETRTQLKLKEVLYKNKC